MNTFPQENSINGSIYRLLLNPEGLKEEKFSRSTANGICSEKKY